MNEFEIGHNFFVHPPHKHWLGLQTGRKPAALVPSYVFAGMDIESVCDVGTLGPRRVKELPYLLQMNAALFYPWVHI